MNVRFLTGRLVSIEAYGANDFEAMVAGDITTLSGEDENVDCTFGDVIFGILP